MGDRTTIAFSLCLYFALPAYVHAAQGVVAAYPSGCDHYIVATAKGYALLEWYGGADPAEGDEVVGDFESYGMKEIHILNRDRETKVWVENFWLSESSAISEYREQCD